MKRTRAAISAVALVSALVMTQATGATASTDEAPAPQPTPTETRTSVAYMSSYGSVEHGQSADISFDYYSPRSSAPVTGTVTLSLNGKSYGTMTVRDGWQRFVLPKTLPAGTYYPRLVYSGDANHLPHDSSTAPGYSGGPLKVFKAGTRTTASMPSTGKRGKRPGATVRVTSQSGSRATGTVQVFVNGKKRSTVRKAAGSSTVRVTLPTMKKKGKKTVRFVYVPDRSHTKSQTTRTMRVR